MADQLPLVGVLGPTAGPGDKPASIGSVVFFDDFFVGGYVPAINSTNQKVGGKFSRTADEADWMVVKIQAVDSDEIIRVANNGHGGQLEIITSNANNDGLQLQMNGEAWRLAADRKLVFETRLKISSITTLDWFVGLSIEHTGTTGVVAESTDYIAFGNTAGAADIKVANGKDDTGEPLDTDSAGQQLTDTTVDMVADTFVTLRFVVDGVSTIRYYVDDVLRATHTETASIPDNEELTPTICLRNASAATNTMTVDYIFIASDRGT